MSLLLKIKMPSFSLFTSRLVMQTNYFLMRKYPQTHIYFFPNFFKISPIEDEKRTDKGGMGIFKLPELQGSESENAFMAKGGKNRQL